MSSLGFVSHKTRSQPATVSQAAFPAQTKAEGTRSAWPCVGVFFALTTLAFAGLFGWAYAGACGPMKTFAYSAAEIRGVYEAGEAMKYPRVGQGLPPYGDFRWAPTSKYGFLKSCFDPHCLSLPDLTQWLLRNARFCKGLKRRIIGFKTNYLRTGLD